MNDRACIVVINVARVNDFSCYGHSQETTPNIDAVAKEDLVLERAVSPAGATRESTASLFSGKYPAEHQAWLSNNILIDISQVDLSLTKPASTTR
jgi:arylsulfatase A-like enzyme